MIIQGSNIPLVIEFDPEDGFSEGNDISVSLEIPGYSLKQWDAGDLVYDDLDPNIVKAPISQEESMEWEPGPCKIKVKWIDDDGNTQFAVASDIVKKWEDKTVLEVLNGDNTE